jgi:hypothetical protein
MRACTLKEQGRGLDRRIMQALTDELELRAPTHAYVADGDAHHLYRKSGFTDTVPESIGRARSMTTG